MGKMTKEKISADRYYLEHQMPYSDADPARLALGLVKPNSAILSCGCGAGREVAYLKSIGCKVTAIDYSRRMIRESKRLAPDADYFETEMSKLTDLNLPSGKFDCITCLYNTINNLANLNAKKDFIFKCYGLLKKEGRMIITTTHRFSSFLGFCRSLAPFIAVQKHKQPCFYYHPSQISKWFSGSAFHIQKINIGRTILIVAQK